MEELVASSTVPSSKQANVLHPDGWKLLQDNATAHTGCETYQWMAEQSMEAIPWPSASPDLNPIENLWKLLKDKVERKLPKTKEQPHFCYTRRMGRDHHGHLSGPH